MSPDGKHVYVAGRDSDAVLAYSRNDTTGKLTYVVRPENATSRRRSARSPSAGTRRSGSAYAPPPVDEGLILFDKPAGITSHDVIDQVRRRLGGRKQGPKVGHAGTLDPFATGLLIVLVGRAATKRQAEFTGLPKAYEVEARLGWTSTT